MPLPTHLCGWHSTPDIIYICWREKHHPDSHVLFHCPAPLHVTVQLLNQDHQPYTGMMASDIAQDMIHPALHSYLEYAND